MTDKNEVPGMRNFASGATRNVDTNKHDYEGFLSPLVIEAFGAYMNHHRHQADGSVRASDNWQKGIPQDVYMKSGWRHFFDWWREHRGLGSNEGIIFALTGLLFNVQGYLLEYLREHPNAVKEALERNKKTPVPPKTFSRDIPGVVHPVPTVIGPSVLQLGQWPLGINAAGEVTITPPFFPPLTDDQKEHLSNLTGIYMNGSVKPVDVPAEAMEIIR